MEDITSLLADLADRVSLPLAGAFSLAPQAFTSNAFLELEKERLFRAEWVCPGRTADIPRPGDYITYSIGDQPVFIIRDGAGNVRTFANVCRHRMMRMLDGSGTCKRVVCPYHSWTYNLEGRLVGVPLGDGFADLDKSTLGLPALRTEVWEGWIYITANPQAPLPSVSLAPLREIVGRYAMADYVPVVTEDKVWKTNWKVVTENFMESYHLRYAHGATLGADYPVDRTEFPEQTFDAFTYSIFTLGDASNFGRAHPDNTRLEGEWRHTSVLPTIFPAHMIVLTPDYLRYLSLRPDGVDGVRIRYGVAVPPEVHASWSDPEAETEKLTGLLERVNEEDRHLVENVYLGAKAPLSRPGPLHAFEREIYDFIIYLARRLGQPEPRR
jgi:phenylpropionate dioxygenase-like ring-hydroxylating dioxygenase large terminal subunit